MKKLSLALLLATSLLLPSACCKKDESSSSNRRQAPTSTVSTSSKDVSAEMLRISGEGGKHLVTLRPKSGGGFDVLDEHGAVTGQVKVQSDRVKFLDKSSKQLAKVKKKSDGIKIYGTGSDAVAKGQWRGQKLRLKDPSGNKFAYLQNSNSTVKGTPIEVRTLGQMMVVKRGGKMVAKINQRLVPAIAAVYGLADELTVEQRTALVIYLIKVAN